MNKYKENADILSYNPDLKINTRPNLEEYETSHYDEGKYKSNRSTVLSQFEIHLPSKKIDMLEIPQFLPDDATKIFSDNYVNAIKFNTEVEGDYANLIQRYVRKEDLSIKDTPLTLDTELLYLNNSLEIFFFTPIIMYIIREIIKKEIKK